MDDAFELSRCVIPYWAEHDNKNERNQAINKYCLAQKLNIDLVNNNTYSKNIKI